MKIEYWKSPKDGEWYWRVKARNGKIILSSEGYRRRATMLKTIESFMQGMQHYGVEWYQITVSK